MTIEPKPIKESQSQIFNVSLRGWIALALVATVCWMSVAGMDVKEPLYTLVGMAVGAYFGQNGKPKSQGQ